MKRNSLFAVIAVTATVLGGAAFADADHASKGQRNTKGGSGMMQGGDAGMKHGGGSGMMGGNMGGMMDMMQRMHGNMMGGNMMGGNMGIMQLLDADGDGKVTPEELQAKLAEYDSNGDGSLSIAEFEVLHSALTRESMVDRFQFLDADGDGLVTAEEMTAPAEEMERMQMMQSSMGHPSGQPGSGQEMDEGTMMQSN